MSEPTPPTGKVILVADDEASMRKVMQLRLVSWGYTVITATNGREAIQMAQERRPDMILLDLMMPEVDGLEVCRQLKAAEETRNTPIVVITANDSRTLPHEVRAAGADGMLQKPYEIPELKKSIQQLLETPSV